MSDYHASDYRRVKELRSILAKGHCSAYWSAKKELGDRQYCKKVDISYEELLDIRAMSNKEKDAYYRDKEQMTAWSRETELEERRLEADRKACAAEDEAARYRNNWRSRARGTGACGSGKFASNGATCYAGGTSY